MATQQEFLKLLGTRMGMNNSIKKMKKKPTGYLMILQI
jgi:hypothetical protein